MNKEKHSKEVVEIANTIVNECGNAPCKECMWCDAATWAHAEALYNAGYRKQNKGEWKPHKDFNLFLRTDVIGGYICSCCENESDETTKFCPECGAKMKGDSDE